MASTLPHKATDRFVQTSGDTVQQYSKGFIPDNTTKNTRWAMNNFNDWMKWRNGREGPTDLVP